MLDDCCSSCTGCGMRVCRETWPINVCTHGLAICEDCAPGECVECATELSWAVVA